MRLRSLIVVMLTATATSLFAQNPYPLKEDVATLDGIIKAYYEVVSGPEGPKQTERDKSLHHSSANVMVTGTTKTGEPFIRTMTLKEFHANTPTDAFYENEIHRVTEQFGSISHVWSTYEFRDTPGGPVLGRGINSIQLYNDGERWWVLNWVYDSERSSNPIPSKYLPE
ncbi:MAG: hypothetical protein AB7O48_08630 [Cyclobacteriaceae bacterium]